MAQLETLDAGQVYAKDHAAGKALVGAAFGAFISSDQGRKFALNPDGTLNGNETPEYWFEKLVAGHSPAPNAPVFHLAVTRDAATKQIVGLATSDYYIEGAKGGKFEGPKGGRYGELAYNVVLDQPRQAEIEDGLRTEVIRQLRETANHVGGGRLRAIFEETDGGPSLMGGQKVFDTTAQAPGPDGKPYHNHHLGLNALPIDDKAITPELLEIRQHAQHAYFNERTVEQAMASKEGLDPLTAAKLAEIETMKAAQKQAPGALSAAIRDRQARAHDNSGPGTP